MFSPIFQTKQKSLAADYEHAHNFDDIQHHFEKFQIAKKDLGVTDEGTLNIDETDFWIGMKKHTWSFLLMQKSPCFSSILTNKITLPL